MERNWRPGGTLKPDDVRPGPVSPPMPPGVRHRFVDVPGLRVHVAEAGAGEPVLLLHGSPQHWWEWHEVIPGLAERYRVICPDQRGVGWTDAPPDGYTRDQLVADLVALLDALELGSVRLVSHDQGALPGYGLCWDHPERVDRHVALAVPPPFVKIDARFMPAFRHVWHQDVAAVPMLGAALLGRGRQPLARHMIFGFITDPEAFSAEDAEVFLTQLRDPARARAASATYRHMVLPEILRILSGRYRRTRLRTPTLVLSGSKEPVFSPEASARLLRGYERHADHVEVGTVDGAGHFIAEERPRELLDLVLDFLARPLAERSAA